MNPSRRNFLRLLLSAPLALELDVEKLLWVPGERTIFLPTIIKPLTLSQITAIELARMYPRLRQMFERDDLLYKALKR